MIEFDTKAGKEFKKLDKAIQKQIDKFLLKLMKSANPRHIGRALKGEPSMAYHTGDMDEWRAGVAVNLRDKTATVYFANSENGHILADQVISPHGELTHGLNYFQKYGFARRPEDLEPNWRELPHVGLGLRRKIPELKEEKKLADDEHSVRRDSIISRLPDTHEVASKNISAANSNVQSSLPKPYAMPILKPKLPGHD